MLEERKREQNAREENRAESRNIGIRSFPLEILKNADYIASATQVRNILYDISCIANYIIDDRQILVNRSSTHTYRAETRGFGIRTVGGKGYRVARDRGAPSAKREASPA